MISLRLGSLETRNNVVFGYLADLFLCVPQSCDLIISTIVQVTAMLSLAAACSSAGVVVLLLKDTSICRLDNKLSCDMYQISVALAFISWFLLAISSYVMFWLAASA